MKRLLLSVGQLALFAFLSGCGGGGGGSTTPYNPLESLPYTGSTSAALIDSADVEELMVIAYFGNAIGNSAFRDLGVESAASPQRPADGANAPALLAAAQEPYIEDGACGGTATYDLDVDVNNGNFHGTITYAGFDDCDLMLTGSVPVSGQLNLQTFLFNNMTAMFELLEMRGEQFGLWVVSGRYEFSEYTGGATINGDLRVRDDSGRVYWFDSYHTTIAQGYDTQSYEDESLAGRFYDPDRGYVDLATETPVRTYVGESVPSSGALLAGGADGASARLSFLSTVLYRVEADTDGDGSYDYDTGRLHYPGANTLPVADAGADIVGNVGCPLELNGSNSSDADLDPLQYAWSITLAPSGSTAQLSNALSATPSFTPDLKGDYRFALTVYDGYDTVVDSVDLTVYGDLFCLNSATLIRYAPSGQYEAGLAVGDVTSDGRNDVLALTRESELYLLTQNASGTLDAPAVHTVDNWRAVAVGDVTGDGKNDAVVTTDGGVGVLKQGEGGGLTAMVEYPFDPALPTAAYSYDLSLGDLNHDGRPDAALLPSGGPVYVFLQNADGTLGPSATYETATPGWSRVMTGDVTGDGLTDIVLSRADSYGSDNIGVLPQLSSGGFGATLYYTVGNLPYTYTYPVALGDLNNDGRLDLVYDLLDDSSVSSHNIGLLPQSATGAFGSTLTYNVYYPPIIDMVVADVTGDGLDDLVTLHGTPHTGLPFVPTTVSVMAATGGGGLAPYDIYPLAQTPQSWGGIAVADVDGDGKNDVVVTSHGCEGVDDCGPSLVVLHGVK